jgi:ligand-binding sensor domain-containing protein/two-component sensor histidine kinase
MLALSAYLLSCSPTLIAASAPVNVSLASFSDQLSQPTISALHKDSTGVLWIGTQSGLNRYDGSTNIIFKTSDTSENWIPAADISQIAQSSNGDLWIATDGGGLAKYNEIHQTFEENPAAENHEYSLLKSLLISRDENIWFESRVSGIGMYNPKLQKYATWLAPDPEDRNVGQSFELVEDELNRIWATGRAGLYMINPSTKSIATYPLPKLENSSNSLITVTAIAHGPSNTLWVGTSAGNILQFDLIEMRYIREGNFWYLSTNWITALQYVENTLWVATDGGLTIVNLTEHSAKTFTSSNSALASNDTLCLLSGEDHMWIGTSRGLNIFSPSVFEKYQTVNSGVFNDVMSFAESSNGDAWVGTFNGVYILKSDTSEHAPIEKLFEGIKLIDRRAMTLAIKNNRLWIGYFSGGVEIVDLESGLITSPNLPKNADMAVTKILHTRSGSTWVATYNHGLYEISNEMIRSFSDPAVSGEKIPEQAVTTILETQDESILVGTETGLYLINPEVDSIRPLNIEFKNNRSPPLVLSINQHENGEIWIGTKGQGLYILSANFASELRPTARSAHGNDQIPSNTIYAIEFDRHQNGWLSTTHGIAKLTATGLYTNHYKTSDGLQSNDFNFAASLHGTDGRLYFGGSNGYNRFYPDHVVADSRYSPIVLTDLNISGKKPELPLAIRYLDSLEVSHADHVITFGFSVLDYIDPKNNQYRYQLKNFDLEWIENGTHNSATYTNLPAGNYVFQVQGANSAGVWNRDGASIALTIHPAPWWSWQAYLAYLLLLSTMAVLAKGYYDGIILRDKALAMAQEMHMAADRASDDLQEQLDFQEDFLRTVYQHGSDTLDLIRDFLARQTNLFSDELFKDAILSNVYRVEALQQLEKSLLYHGDQLLVSPEELTNGIINSHLQQHPEMAPFVITINQMPSQLISAEYATPLCIILFELIQNCFEHAFEASSTANYIQIELEKKRDEKDNGVVNSIQISVTDSGVGIPHNILPGTVETSGLAIVSSIVEKLDGEIEASVNQGTRISITIPGNIGLV